MFAAPSATNLSRSVVQHTLNNVTVAEYSTNHPFEHLSTLLA
jgi:hypothetical protein